VISAPAAVPADAPGTLTETSDISEPAREAADALASDKAETTAPSCPAWAVDGAPLRDVDLAVELMIWPADEEATAAVPDGISTGAAVTTPTDAIVDAPGRA
jgi:hypothetical protein